MNVALLQESSTQFASTDRHAVGRPARVEVYRELAQAAPDWQRLQAAGALSTPYQRFEWIALWHRHVSAQRGVTPLIVVGSDRDGAPLFLWPFAQRRIGPLIIAEYFGGRHANLNTGLWRRDVAAEMTAVDIDAVLSQVAADHGIDLFVLLGQPVRLEGIANPFSLLPRRDAPDEVYALSLSDDSPQEALKHAVSANMRGRLRSKERKLQSLAGYRYLSPTTVADVDRILDAFFVQKAARLAARGIDNAFAAPEIVAFVRAGCHEGLAAGHPVIELHALEGGGEVIAVFGVAKDARRMSCMFNSYTLGEAGRWSPGLVLLTHIIARCAEQRLATFDLGVGYASYKNFFCRDVDKTFDSFIPFTPLGRLAAMCQQSTRQLKRCIKSNPYLWDATQALRRRLGA